jgi:hypothetical protein
MLQTSRGFSDLESKCEHEYERPEPLLGIEEQGFEQRVPMPRSVVLLLEQILGDALFSRPRQRFQIFTTCPRNHADELRPLTVFSVCQLTDQRFEGLPPD